MSAEKSKYTGPTGDTYTNSLGIEFVLIPAGTFDMGDIAGGGKSNERPPHEVTISRNFYLGTFEVTQSQWEAVMGTAPSHFAACPECPVEQVSWHDANTFIGRLNQLEETDAYRLPTEAEWEYSARAGTNTKWSFGSDESTLGEYAWYAGNSKRRTHPVGERMPNPWGLYDMAGNVPEWVNDKYDGAYYRPGPAVDPSGPDTGIYRVARGGGWFDGADNVRSAVRFYASPGLRHHAPGFRLLREAL